MKERPAEWIDTIGIPSKKLFARHKDSGHRITVRMFYQLSGDGTYEREGYVLMTTAPRHDAIQRPTMF